MKRNTDKTIVADNVRNLRNKEGLTLESLGLRAGISKGHLWGIENGRTDPQATTLKRLADALAVTVDRLFVTGTPQTDDDLAAILRFSALPECSKVTARNVIESLWENHTA